MHSFHSHSGSFCRHAKGTLEEVVQEAIKQGFQVFGLSEHAPRYRQEDLYPEESDLDPSRLMEIYLEFLTEAERLQSKYASEITLLIGIETDFITDLDLDGLSALLQKEQQRIDYMVGSLHHANGIPLDFDKETFEKCIQSFEPSLVATANSTLSHQDQLTQAYLLSYFDNQYKLIARFHPEVVGHFDLCRLYNPSQDFKAYPGVWEAIERNVRLVVEYGGLFELNAAAFRKGWNDAYPGWDVLQIIINAGGRLCLSDDSHGPLAVGLNYHLLYEYLRSHHIEELWYLTPAPMEGEVTDRARRKVAPKMVKGVWWEDKFWKTHGGDNGASH